MYIISDPPNWTTKVFIFSILPDCRLRWRFTPKGLADALVIRARRAIKPYRARMGSS
jgi:hypothetical protein